MKFCLGIHNHQPTGNFNWVIEKIHRESYGPLLKALYKHPKIKFSLHVSGILLDWYRRREPAGLKEMRTMAERGQAEIVGGAYYEPILPAIPRRDRRGQIDAYMKAARRLLGVQPRGLWIAERVWEPELAEDLAQAGIEYTLLDDYHFLIAGVKKETLDGYYVTEYAGAYLKVFPIDAKSRALIPFKPVAEVEAYLRECRAKGAKALFYFDDGEKFGSWPGTGDWVHAKGWLEGFLVMLAELSKSGIESATYAEVLDALKPAGICYPPGAAYAEMEGWALPAVAYRELQAHRRIIEKSQPEGSSPYLRGAVWKNFLVKYPESNRMHKAMLSLSGALDKPTSKLLPQDRRRLQKALYASQCNDAYWHGVFGGLYLPHLRQEIWSRLCEIKEYFNRSLHEPVLRLAEIPWEGSDAALFDSPQVSATWMLKDGGYLSELLVLKRRLNVLNTLAQHPEGYHGALEDKFKELKCGVLAHMGDDLDIPMALLAGIAAQFKSNPRARASFLDVFFDPGPDSKTAFENSRIGTFGGDAMAECKVSGGKLRLRYRRGMLEVQKTVRFLPQEGFEVSHTFRNSGSATLRSGFGTEINFYLAVCEPAGQTKGSIAFRDALSGTTVRLKTEGEEGFWHYPVMTRHLSEQGLNNTYQGTCVMPHWRLELAPSAELRVKTVLTVG